MGKIYYDKDADLKILKKKTIAIVGYGSQGHAHARNLHDSGMKVLVGLRKESAFWQRAQKDGLKVMTVPEASKAADIIMILIPDDKQRAMYESDIKPHLKKDNAIAFGHGFNIHFGQVVPPDNVDVFMVAPKGPGHLVRRTYEQGAGVPCLLAIQQDVTKNAKKSPSPMPRLSAVRGPAFWRPPSRKKPKPICSASRRSCAAALPN